jgi:hypothetical protein
LNSLCETLPSPLVSIWLNKDSDWLDDKPEELSALANCDSLIELLPPLIWLKSWSSVELFDALLVALEDVELVEDELDTPCKLNR